MIYFHHSRDSLRMFQCDTKFSIFITLLIGAVWGASFSTTLPPQALGTFEFPNVAYVALGRFPRQPTNLFLSSFGVSAPGAISYVPHFASDLNNFPKTSPILISDKITWPNEFEVVPPNAIPNKKVASVAGGFIPPPFSTGAINLVDFTSGTPSTPVQITTDKRGFFYHRVRWYDVDGDCHKDIFTARASTPVFGPVKGELVLLKNPGNTALEQIWEETVIAEGPDVFFDLIDIDRDGVPEIVAAQFFSKKLAIYWTDSGDWSDSSSVRSNVIDSTLGPVFGVTVDDLNNDGRPDLLVTNHVSVSEEAGIWGYEYPLNWKTEPWIKHVIRVGFVTNRPGPDQASPGAAFTFRPLTYSLGKPWILLAGDGTQEAYLFKPKYLSSHLWSYDTLTFVTNGTVGQVTAGDVSHDGFSEFFFPDYDNGLVYGYTFDLFKNKK